MVLVHLVLLSRTKLLLCIIVELITNLIETFAADLETNYMRLPLAFDIFAFRPPAGSSGAVMGQK